MQKDNYKYYLANGTEIEYALLPDSSLVDVINGLALLYTSRTGKVPEQVSVSPKIASALNKTIPNYVFQTVGWTIMRIQTTIGSLEVKVIPRLELPIFIGSEQEYEDNTFNKVMDEALSE